jgi:hypothetical protein
LLCTMVKAAAVCPCKADLRARCCCMMHGCCTCCLVTSSFVQVHACSLSRCSVVPLTNACLAHWRTILNIIQVYSIDV